MSREICFFICLCDSAVSLLTVCGNLLVIISVSHFKQLHTPANILILSLAVSDLLVGVFVHFQATSVSVHTVALIAVDRFLALSSPFLYSEKISPTVICIVTLFNWLFSLIYNFILLFVNGNITDVTCPGICIAIIDGVSSFVDLIVVFLMPCTLIILYTHVFVIVKKHVTAIRALQVHISTGSKQHSDNSTAQISTKSCNTAGDSGLCVSLVFTAILYLYFSEFI